VKSYHREDLIKSIQSKQLGEHFSIYGREYQAVDKIIEGCEMLFLLESKCAPLTAEGRFTWCNGEIVYYPFKELIYTTILPDDEGVDIFTADGVRDCVMSKGTVLQTEQWEGMPTFTPLAVRVERLRFSDATPINGDDTQFILDIMDADKYDQADCKYIVIPPAGTFVNQDCTRDTLCIRIDPHKDFYETLITELP